MSLNRDIDETIQQVEWILVQLQTAHTLPEEQVQVKTIAPFQAACQRLNDLGPGTITALRQVLFSLQYHDFNRALAAARILATLPFPEATSALLDAALSSDTTVMTRGQRALQYLLPSEETFHVIMDAFVAPATDEIEQNRRHLLIDALGRQTVPAFFTAAAQWIQHHPDVYVRRSLALSLAVAGGSLATPLLQAALNDRDTKVKLRGAFGLILAAERQHLPFMLEAIQARSASIRKEALALSGLLTLPAVVQPVLHALSDSSTEVRLAAIVRSSSIGVRESFIPLAVLLDDKNPRVAEQAAAILQDLAGKALPYQWQGRRLTPGSLAEVQAACQELSDSWQRGIRYLHGQPATLNHLANALLSMQASDVFWNLVSMTGQRLGFDPRVDLLSNYHAIQRWRAWARAHNEAFLAGRWYYLGQQQNAADI